MAKKLLVSLVLLFSLVCTCKGQEPVPDKRGYIVRVGDKVKDFDIKLLDGSTVNLSQLRAKIVVLNFFASW
jgi:peroxiredoxin